MASPVLARQQSVGSLPTHVRESTVINAPVNLVWDRIKGLDFTWWSVIASVELTDGPSASTVGAMFQFTFKDGMTWTVQLSELSEIHRTVTFEVVASNPDLSVSSVIHSLNLKRVTANNTTFLEWTTDFSNDATAEVIQDSKFKKLDAFADLAAALGV